MEKTDSSAILSLEEKSWAESRRSLIEKYASVGAVIGGSSILGVSFIRPLPPWKRSLFLASGIAIGGLSGLLFADSESLKELEKLSDDSKLKKQLYNMASERKLSKVNGNVPEIKVTPREKL